MNRLSLRYNWLKFKTAGKFTDPFRGIHRIYPWFNEGKPERCQPCNQPVGLANTRISTDDYAQKSPRSLVLPSSLPHESRSTKCCFCLGWKIAHQGLGSATRSWPLRRRAKSRDHEIVRAQKEWPETPPDSIACGSQALKCCAKPYVATKCSFWWVFYSCGVLTHDINV
jgi:hypothetical protein